jgi:SAM-dependent methyltransferase
LLTDWEAIAPSRVSNLAERHILTIRNYFRLERTSNCMNELESTLSDQLSTDKKRKSDLTAYRASVREQSRISDILASVPSGFSSVLDIGARDGYISKLLARDFAAVTALDLEKPEVSNEKVVAVEGDITKLDFPDNAFDVVVCTEVLEHIPTHQLGQACRETSRVARYAVLVGVPYRQDRRMGATLCVFCGRQNPCWGHVNDFDEAKLKRLFEGLTPIRTSYVGRTKDRTNAVSAFLMRRARNPWGTYEQDEACVHCGKKLIRPNGRTVIEAGYARIASIMNHAQSLFIPWRPTWIHMVFQKAALNTSRQTTSAVDS